MFWLGLIIGFIIGGIVDFIIEILCIAAGRSETDYWMEEDTPLEPPNSHVDED